MENTILMYNNSLNFSLKQTVNNINDLIFIFVSFLMSVNYNPISKPNVKVFNAGNAKEVTPLIACSGSTFL